MNGQYRTIMVEFSPHIEDLELPPHLEFSLMSEEDSYGLLTKVLLHGTPYTNRVALNEHLQIVLKPSKLKYLQQVSGCEDISLWEKMTPIFQSKMEKCPSLCLPRGYVGLTH